MRLGKGVSRVTLLFSVLTAIVLATNVAAYNGTDFQNPPDWMAHGNDRSNPGYGSYEPINVIISGNSQFDLVSYLGWVGWSQCAVSNLQAKVQPGGSYVNQIVELRDGGCQETALGGNHLRAWRQNLPGGHWAYFMAVSEEHDCRVNGSWVPNWHCIDPVGWNGGKGGFNQGRDDFVSNMRYLVSIHRFNFNNMTVETPGLYGAGHGKDKGENGWDYVPYDGRVAVLTVKH